MFLGACPKPSAPRYLRSWPAVVQASTGITAAFSSFGSALCVQAAPCISASCFSVGAPDLERRGAHAGRYVCQARLALGGKCCGKAESMLRCESMKKKSSPGAGRRSSCCSWRVGRLR